MWSHHPESAVISIVTLLGSIASQRNRDLSRWWYAVSAAFIFGGVLTAAIVGSDAVKLTGLLIMVAGVGATFQVLFIRANHIPAEDEPTLPAASATGNL